MKASFEVAGGAAGEGVECRDGERWREKRKALALALYGTTVVAGEPGLREKLLGFGFPKRQQQARRGWKALGMRSASFLIVGTARGGFSIRYSGISIERPAADWLYRVTSWRGRMLRRREAGGGRLYR
jgi:hypothetical protein